MIETITLFPGVTLRCHNDHRFKQGCLSLQLVRPMCREEAARNALLPAVWLRGTKQHPDLRSITLRLDELYGAAVGTMVRRIGDYQTTGLYCNFMEDRFALEGDKILQPMIGFIGELLLESVTEDGAFSRAIVESEKKNLICAIEAEGNDKRVYAMSKLIRTMCREDSFGLPRLGTVKQVAAITPEDLMAHHKKILSESPLELFYVGSRPAREVAGMLTEMLAPIRRSFHPIPAQCAFRDAGGTEKTETQQLAQSQLCLGFVTPITNRSDGYAAMQVLNTLFGAGMTSKLFMNVREKQSLCYSISSSYYGTKGIVTVSAGIDADKEALAREEIMAQLAACQEGRITDAELESAKEAVLSSLRGIHDSPGSIEGYYSTGALSGFRMTPEQYRQAVEAVQLSDCVAAAQSLTLHSKFFLEGRGS